MQSRRLPNLNPCPPAARALARGNAARRGRAMHLDFDMALADESRPTPRKNPKRRPHEPPRLRGKPAARARQVAKAKGRKATTAAGKGRRHKAVKLKVNADTHGLRPPTSAELRCPVSSSTDSVDPVTEIRTGGVITVGADCAGLLSEALALDYLGVQYKHKFAAESNVKVRHLLYSKFGKGSMQFYRNVILRDNTKREVPRVHLYVFGAPCQSFSPAGKREGLRDDRGQIMYSCLDYVKHKKPLIAVAENSAALATKRWAFPHF